MEAVKKWLAERSTKKDGIYVHYSPPKAVGASAAQLRQWARSGLGSKLERAVLAGHGRRLLAEARAQLGPAAAPALRALAVRCAALHAAVERGSLAELQELLDNESNRRKNVMCCDEAGVGLLHKAVYYDYMDIAEWLVDNYPQLVHQKDSEGRTALHYAGGCRDAGGAAALLERAGAARGARDAAGRTPAHYQHQRTPLALPAPPPLTDAMPPDKHPQAMAIKRHNIRIWCHDCDMARLQRVVWEGHGARLLSEVSNQPVVKRFLEAVPYIMNTIREIHNTVVQNDLEGLIKLAGDPVPPQALSSRDANYMTVLHKAAGLGHASMVKYIVDRYPQGINDVDNDGRSPLHYAAIVKDDQHTYNTLVGFGADEGAVDNKNRTPGYYLNRPQDIDKNVFKTLPEAPRTASSAYPPQWDWKLLDTEVVTDLNKKPKKKGSNVNGHSNKSNSMSDNTVNRVDMKASSTNEFIKGLPDLEDKPTRSNNIVEISKDQEVIEKEHTENDLEIDQTDPSITKNNLEDTGHEIKDGNISIVNTSIESDNNIETADTNQDDIGREADEPNLKAGSPEIAREQMQENIEEAPNEYHDQNEENINTIDKESETINYDKFLDHSVNKNDDLSQKLGHVKDDEVNHLKLEEANADDDVRNENLLEPTDDCQSIVKENKSSEEIDDDKSLHKTDSAKENKLQESEPNDQREGNLNSDNNEDDDDVQVQGDSNSEYSDSNLRSTAEATDTKSAKRGNVNNSRNSQESLIEGIIHGEAELESQDASVLQKDDTDKGRVSNMVDNEIDPEVTELISTANMEMLAALVLNGEGARLVGRTSRNSELQAFLDNVPTYMQKINRVHLAAKEGNIKELQAALDRRKFAIARDPISPNGATPLHVATVFGKTNIVKYLGGRFPETLSAVDFEGRTALHYAAVLPDNGHYYNLLQQLGSNSKDLDDNGRSAEDYFKNPTLFPFKQLLAEFDISEEAAKDMLSDKIPEDRASSRRMLDTPESLDTLDRCYRLLASARPIRTPLSASSNKATPPLVLGRFLKKAVFETIKNRITKLDHDLFDVIWPAVKKLSDNRNVIQTVEEDFPGGITAPDYYVYDVFQEFLKPLIKDLHNINSHTEISNHPPSNFNKTFTNEQVVLTVEPLVELNVDPNDDFILSGTIECSRNVKGYELPINLKIGQLEAIERIVTTALMQEQFAKFSELSYPESDQKGGIYYTLNEVLDKPSEICAALASAGLLVSLCDREDIDDCTRLHGKHWPYGRGVYVSDDKTVAVWINVHDHIRVVISTPLDAPGEIGLPFSKLSFIMTYFHEKLDFVWDFKLGHLSSRPTFLGAGIRFSFIVHFPGLSKDAENMKHLCAMRGLQYRETLSPDIAKVSNYQCLNITENNCFNDFTTAVSNLLHLERDLSLHNSAHIAHMLTNIFRRKRSSLADLESPEKQQKSN